MDYVYVLNYQSKRLRFSISNMPAIKGTLHCSHRNRQCSMELPYNRLHYLYTRIINPLKYIGRHMQRQDEE